MRRRLVALVATLAVIGGATAAIALDRAHRPLDDDRYVLLVMGSDMGPWRAETALDGRSDALHLVVVVPSAGRASILSFPRDLWVPVPGVGTTRINAALTRGPETAVATVEQLVGVEIDDWVATGMGAFVRGQQEYGPLEVDVPQPLRIDQRSLSPGVQELDGHGVLLYTRDRKNRADGDFGRNRAQAEVLALLHADLVDRDPSPAELADVLRTFRRHTVSSIPAARLPVLAGVALDIDPADVVRAQVPGVNAFRGQASVVVATGGAEALFADLRDDGMLTP